MSYPSETLEPPAHHELVKLPTSIIGDSQDRFGLPVGLRPVWNSAPFAGPARTVLTAPGDNLGIHEALQAARRGDVLVVDGGGYEARALVGDLIAEKAKALDLAALVIDGAVRDVAELAEVGVPVYARAVLPAGPWKNGPFRLDVPVSIGGVVVMPGDVVVGDGDGLAVVSPGRVRQVLQVAQERLSLEEASRQRSRDLRPRD